MFISIMMIIKRRLSTQFIVLILLDYVIAITALSSLTTRYNGGVVRQSEELFPLAIIHMNDFHARFEETDENSTDCDKKSGEKCIGGYARVYTMVNQLMEEHKDKNPLYLNAGDNFHGTMWYNFGRWNVTSYFLNLLKADVMTIGNHEFGNQISGLVPFLDAIESPIVVCNIDDSEEPSMQGKYEKSIIIEKYGRKIGVIGVILSTTNMIATTGNLKFLDESQSILIEVSKLKAQDVNIIIVLSHCGLDTDKRIASEVGSEIDIIVGGHSHTFMYTGNNSPGPDRPRDNYPAIVNGVLIVQASAYTKYIGNIILYFDEAGNIVNYDGSPIYLDANVEQDPYILHELQPWKEQIDVLGQQVVGSTKVVLEKSNCHSEECSLGTFVTASYIDHYVSLAGEGEWTYASIGIISPGGIRTPLAKGDLKYADLVTVIPFENTIDTIELRGDHILDLLEHEMLQFTGLKVTYNTSQPFGNRISDVEALCNKCLVPRYYPLDKNEYYRISLASFLVTGADGFPQIKDNYINHQIGESDITILVNYVQNRSPIMIGVDGRYTVVN